MDGYSYISPVPTGSTIWSSTNMAMGKAPVFMGKMDSPEPNHLGAPNVAWFPSSPGWAKSIKAHKSCAHAVRTCAERICVAISCQKLTWMYVNVYVLHSASHAQIVLDTCTFPSHAIHQNISSVSDR